VTTTETVSLARYVCRSAAIFSALMLPHAALAASRPSLCTVSLGKLLPWVPASQGHQEEAPPLVRRTLKTLHDSDADSIDSFSTSARDNLASYVFKVQVLQNKHPGYYFWTRVYFGCDIEGTCEFFDFSNSRTINFPTSVNVYRNARGTLLVARGYDESANVRSVERYVVLGNKLAKC